MGESTSSSSSQSFFKKHYEGFKEFWTERFSFLENYASFVQREKPIPSWSDSDVEEFIASDPVNGPTVCNSLSLFELFVLFCAFFKFFLAFPHLGICFLMGLSCSLNS